MKYFNQLVELFEVQHFFLEMKQKECKRRQKFTPEEDEKIRNWCQDHQIDGDKYSFRGIQEVLPNRTPRQCRERYNNYLNPKLLAVPFTRDEVIFIGEWIQKCRQIGGPKWVSLQKYFPYRSQTALKNAYNKYFPPPIISHKPCPEAPQKEPINFPHIKGSLGPAEEGIDEEIMPDWTVWSNNSAPSSSAEDQSNLSDDTSQENDCLDLLSFCVWDLNNEFGPPTDPDPTNLDNWEL